MAEQIGRLKAKQYHLQMAFFHSLMAYAGRIGTGETEGEKLRIYEEAVIDLSKRAASVETARTEINHYNNSATQRD